LNSLIGAAGESHGSEPATLPDFGSEVGDADFLIGETMTSETAIRETLTGAAFGEASEWSAPETILLVEDEEFVRTATAEVLESAGYRVVTAGTAEQALVAYRSCCWPVDLLLADIVMPGMNGRELAIELEKFYPRTRILLMSGYAEQLACWESSACGKQCLAKPFSILMLLRRVREVLDKPFESRGCRTKSRAPCGSAWPAESREKSGIAVQPGRVSPSPHKREACHRPHNSPRPGPQ
jgi:CheY-like chemotaxis protein